jgi:hypothetical protein
MSYASSSSAPGSSSNYSGSTNGKAPVAPTPSNLRFQRRTSERAFYEGAYRDGGPGLGGGSGTMDYSQGAGAGSSPWASSPEASRTSFSNDHVPRQDLPGPAMSGGGDEEGRYAYPTPPPGGGSWSPEQQGRWQHEQPAHHEQQQHHHRQEEVPRPSTAEENRRPQSARYHGHQQQRQHMPSYKLQAKITGLERSGKKDPILKFDVYVCFGMTNTEAMC